MKNSYSRREFINRLGLSGVAAGFGAGNLLADQYKPGKEELESGKIVKDDKGKSAVLRSGKIFQPERELQMKCEELLKTESQHSLMDLP